jgi:2-oxoglutarate dehydrogenase E2 component (dihydrolipoamide succinyltransferase)
VLVEVKVPVLAESIAEATLLNWHKRAGEKVKRGESLIDIETDKVTLEVAALNDGVLVEILKDDGELVQSDEVIARIDTAMTSAKTPQNKNGQDPQPEQQSLPEMEPVAHSTEHKTSPAVRNLLEEHNLDASQINPSGNGGRLTKEDIIHYMAEKPTASVTTEVPTLTNVVNEEQLTENESFKMTGAEVLAQDEIPTLASTENGQSNNDEPLKGIEPEEIVDAEATMVESIANEFDDNNVPPSANEPDVPLTTETVRSESTADESGENDKPQSVTDIPTPAAIEVTTQEPTAAERPEEKVPMTRLRKRIAERLLAAQHENAILTTFNEVNMQPVMDLRTRYKEEFEKRHGVKLGFMSFFTKAAVEALKKFPIVNASVDGEHIVYHGYFDIGIAVSTPRGLVVPIVRNADVLSLAEIEICIREYSDKARDSKLTIDELMGGTFTITNGGVFGSLLSTPIINPPQSAILGMHKIQERPMVENGEIVIRPIMYLALSYDHRIIDGSEAVQFLVSIKQQIEDPARLMLQL